LKNWGDEIYHMTYQKFRVKTPIKSFRDLEVYQESIKLAAQIFRLKPPPKLEEELSEEIKILLGAERNDVNREFLRNCKQIGMKVGSDLRLAMSL
jgi:hypothetical protein